MLPGVTAAFVLQAKWDGSLDADYACLEVDEASAQHIFRFIKPDILVLLNLFRDQLDRYGELDHTVDLLKQALDKVPKMQLVVNADDPLVYSLALESGHPILTFGIRYPVLTQPAQREIRDGGFCRKCGTRLDYQYYQFGQLGRYNCPGCGFSRPDADYEAASISLEHGIAFKVGNYTFHMPGRGVYTIYNMLAVCCAGRAAGLQMEQLQAALAGYRVPNGRMETFRISGKEIILNLAKNPAGFNQNLEALRADPADKEILIVIHDQAADGRDISWLWDVEFERLHTDTVHAIKACGIRALDLQLRMKYEDLRSECVPDVRCAVRESLVSQSPVLYILVNYTALLPVRTFLQKLQKRSLHFSKKGIEIKKEMR